MPRIDYRTCSEPLGHSVFSAPCPRCAPTVIATAETKTSRVAAGEIQRRDEEVITESELRLRFPWIARVYPSPPYDWGVGLALLREESQRHYFVLRERVYGKTLKQIANQDLPVERPLQKKRVSWQRIRQIEDKAFRKLFRSALVS